MGKQRSTELDNPIKASLGYDNQSTPKIQSSILGNPIRESLEAKKPIAEVGARLDDNRHKTTIDATKYEKYMPYGVYTLDSIDKVRASNQGLGSKVLGFLNQAVVGELLGGTIEGVGAAGDVTVGLLSDKLNNEEFQFGNFMTEFGKSIRDWTAESTPIYQKDPSASWQWGDTGWWAQNLVSVASGVSMLAGGTGLVKGLGYAGKLIGVADKIGDVSKYWGEVAITSGFMRNAEAMRDASETALSVRDKTYEMLASVSDEEFEKIKSEQNEVPRNLTRAEFSEALGNKSGWTTYKLNTINYAFDFMQVAGIFKAVKGRTRTGTAGSTKVANSQKSLLNKVSDYKPGVFEKYIAPIASGFTEVPEEMINYAASQAGERVGTNLGKKSDDVVTKFLEDAVSDRGLESGFFGLVGGKVFNAVGGLMNKADNNRAISDKIGEIESRLDTTKKSTAKIKTVVEDYRAGNITKEEAISSIKAESYRTGFDMGVSAAKVGNVDLLIETLSNNDFRSSTNLSEGVEDFQGIDASIFSSIQEGALAAEKSYQKVYSKLFYSKQSDHVKQALRDIIIETDKDANYLDNISKDKTAKATELLETSDPVLTEAKRLRAEQIATKAAIKTLRSNPEVTKFFPDQKRLLEAIDKLEAQAASSTVDAGIPLDPSIEAAADNLAEAKVLSAFSTELTYMSEDFLNPKRIKEVEAAFAAQTKKRKDNRKAALLAEIETKIREGKTAKEIRKEVKTSNNEEARLLNENLRALQEAKEPLISRAKAKAERFKNKFESASKKVGDTIANIPNAIGDMVLIDPEQDDLNWNATNDEQVEDVLNEATAEATDFVNDKLDESSSIAPEDISFEIVNLDQIESENKANKEEFNSDTTEVATTNKKRKKRNPSAKPTSLKSVENNQTVLDLQEEVGVEPAVEILEAQDTISVDTVATVTDTIEELLDDASPLVLSENPLLVDPIAYEIVEEPLVVLAEPLTPFNDIEIEEDFGTNQEPIANSESIGETNNENTFASMYIPAIVNPSPEKVTDTTVVLSSKDSKVIKTLNKLRALLKKDGQVKLSLKIIATEERFQTEDPNESVIGIFYGNTQLGFVNRVSSMEKEIKRLEGLGMTTSAHLRRVNLLETIKIRKAFATNKKSKVVLKKLSVGGRKKATNGQLTSISALNKAMGLRVYVVPESAGSTHSSTLQPLSGNGAAFDSKFIRDLYNKDMLYSAANVFVLVPSSPNLSINFNDYNETQTAIPLFIDGNAMSSEDVSQVVTYLNELIAGLKEGKNPFKDQSMIDIKQNINRITMLRQNVRDKDDNFYAPTFVVHGASKNNKGRIEFLTGDNKELISIYVAPNNEVRITKTEWKGTSTKYPNITEYNNQKGARIPIGGKDVLVLSPETRTLFSTTIKEALATKRYNLFLEKGKEAELENLILNSDRFGVNIKVTESPDGEILSLFGGKFTEERGSDNVTTQIALDDKVVVKTKIATSVKKKANSVNKTKDTKEALLPVEREDTFDTSETLESEPLVIDPTEDVNIEDLTDLLTDGLTFKESLNSTSDEIVESNESQITNFHKIVNESIPIELLPYQLLDNGDVVYGVFKNASVALSKYSVVGTEYHEAFHAIFNLYHTEAQRLDLLQEAINTYGLEEDLNTEDSKIRVEEVLAEKFRSYMLSKDAGIESKSVIGKIKEWFNKLYNTLKSYIGKKDVIDNLFESASRGDFKKSSVMDFSEVERFGIVNQAALNSNAVRYHLVAYEKLMSEQVLTWYDKKGATLLKQNKQVYLDKLQKDFQIPKAQFELVKDIENPTPERMAIELMANYSYVVEVNRGLSPLSDVFDPDGYYDDEDGNTTLPAIAPSEFYSTLTVAGGTNYQENEIATPEIIPTIKGHAEFSTDNGIGWFRSDTEHLRGSATKVDTTDKARKFLTVYDKIALNPNELGFSLDAITKTPVELLLGSGDAYRQEVLHIIDLEDQNRYFMFLEGQDGKEITKTQYDSWQKQEWQGTPSKTRRILEIQTDLFQKGRKLKTLAASPYRTQVATEEGELDRLVSDTPEANSFLQLLNKDNNWVGFFIKSIVQDSVKAGYEKVLFPSGETAAKIEGHQTIADEIIRIDSQIENVKSKDVSVYNKKDGYYLVGSEGFLAENEETALEYLETKRNELKTEGIEKLKPVEAFYEVRVKNFLTKNYPNAVTTITDEHGSTWNELDISKLPSQEVIRFSKANKGEKIPDTFDVFKPEEQSQYIKYAGLLIMRYLNKVDSITPEDIQSGKVLTLKEAVKTALKRHASTLEEDSIAKKTTNYLAGLLETSDNSFWQKSADYVRNSLRVDVSNDDNIDTSSLSKQMMNKLWDDAAQTKVSSKAALDFELKRFLMTTEKVDTFDFKIVNGDPVFSYIPSKNNLAKLPEVENFSVLYGTLSTQLADSIDIKEMMAKIMELSKLNPSFALLYQRLKLDETYQEKLFTAFNKAKVDSIQLSHSTGDALRMSVPTVSYKLANAMADSVKVVVESYNSNQGKSLITSAKIMKFREWNIKVRESLKSNDKVKAIAKKDILSMLRALGITITKAQLDLALSSIGNLETFEKNKVIRVTEGIVAERLRGAIFKLGEELFNQTLRSDKIVFDEQGRVSEIAAFFQDVFLDVKEPSFYNTERSLQYALQKPLFINKFFSTLGQVYNRKTINKIDAYNTIVDRIQSLLKDDSNKFSNWLNSIVFLKDMSLKDNNAKNFNFLWFNGIKDLDTFIGKPYNAVTDFDWSSARLSLFMKERDYAYYSLPVLSDSGNIGVIKAPIYKGFFNGSMLDSSDLKRALMNIIYYDLQKANNARMLLFGDSLTEEVKDNLLIGYHYKSVDSNNEPILVDSDGIPTGAIFKMLSLTYTEKGKLRTIANIIGLDDNDNLVFRGEENKLAYPLPIFNNGIYDSSTLTSNKRRVLSKFVDQFAISEVAQSLNKYVNIANDISDDVEKSDYSNTTDLVSDFILNSFIATQEIAALFNGHSAQFKGVVDNNKRSKQLISPTQYLSTKHRGRTSKYIVIPDVYITPDTLKPNSENLAKAMLRHSNKYKGLKYNHEIAFGEGTKNLLETKVYELMSPYLSVNSTDGQGFISLDYFEALVKDRGINGKKMKALIANLRGGREFDSKYMKDVLQILKPYYFNNSVNSVTGVSEAVQIKTSVQVLIPSLVKGTVLETLLNVAPKDLSHIYTESAVKDGRKRNSVVTLNNLKGSFESIESSLKYTAPSLKLSDLNIQELDNSQWGLQLDVPEHLKDTTNNLSIQAKKALFSNIQDSDVFKISDTKLNGKQLHEKIQSVFSEISTRGTDEIVTSMSNPQEVAKVLERYMDDNDLPAHYRDLLRINETSDNFVIPLSIPSFANKFQSLLIKPFIEKGIKVPVAGGHATLLSDAFITNFIGLDNIDFSAFTKEVGDRIRATGSINLKQSIVSDGKSKYIETECLLPAWTRKFFKNGERIKIEDLPEEARQILGHRTPLEGKYSFLSLKVVGFLPEALGSTIVLPAALVAQTGHDFDVDSEYLIFRYLDKDNVPIKYDLSADVSTWSKEALNNFIFDSYKTITEHPSQIIEHIVPSTMEEVKVMVRRQKALLGIVEDSENHNSLATQDRLRSINMMGRSLKGIAVSYSGMIPIAQKLKLVLNTGAIQVAYDPSKYDIKTLSKDYTVEEKDGKYLVTHNKLGWSKKGFIDPNGDLISMGLAKTVANVLDIVKEGTLLNFNLYTGSNYMVMRTLGIPLEEASLFLIQPIITRAYTSAQNDIIYQGKVKDPKGAYLEILKKINKQIKTPYISYKDIPVGVLDAQKLEESIKYFKDEKPKKYSTASPVELEKLRDQVIYQLGLLKLWNQVTAVGYDYKKVMDGTMIDRTKASSIPELLAEVEAYDSMSGEDVSSISSSYLGTYNSVGLILNTTDAYKSITTYAQNIRKYLNTLGKYFIDTNPTMIDAAKIYSRNYSPEIHKKIVEVGTFSLLNDRLNESEAIRILRESPNTNTKMELEEFKQLSTANKLWFIKYRLKDAITPTNILYHLSPKISESDFNLKGFYEIKFDKPNLSDGLDGFMSQSFSELLNSNSEFLKDLGEDLIKYNFITQGFSFSGNSFANYIPVKHLEEQGWLDKLKLSTSISLEDLGITYEVLIDLAGRNGWKDDKLSKINFINKDTLPEDDAFHDINNVNSFVLSASKKKELGYSANYYTFIVKSNGRTETIQTLVTKVDDSYWFIPVNRLSNGYIKTEATNFSLINSQNSMFSYLNTYSGNSEDISDSSRIDNVDEDKTIC